MKTDVCQSSSFVNPQRDHVGHNCARERPESRADPDAERRPKSGQYEQPRCQDEEKDVEPGLQSDPQRIGMRGHGQSADARTLTPRGATRTDRTFAPAPAIAAATRSFAPRSTRKKTQPPPPAPHTFAPTDPARRVTSTSRSISGVVIPGAFFLRLVHSSRSSRAAS